MDKIKKARDRSQELADALIGDNNKAARLWVEEVVRLLDNTLKEAAQVTASPAPTPVTPIAALEEQHLRVVIEKEKALIEQAKAHTAFLTAQREEIQNVLTLEETDRRMARKKEQYEVEVAKLESQIQDLAEGIRSLTAEKETAHLNAVKMEERCKAAQKLLEKLNGEVNEKANSLKPLKGKKQQLTATIGEQVAEKSEQESATE